MALASLLPLPLLWGFTYIYFSGSFDFRPRVALLGAFIGLVAGALWPRAMLAPLACAMGIALLAWALPIPLSFPCWPRPPCWPALSSFTTCTAAAAGERTRFRGGDPRARSCALGGNGPSP